MKMLFLMLPFYLAAVDTVNIELIPVIRGSEGTGLGLPVSVGGGNTVPVLFDTGSSGLFIADSEIGPGGINQNIPYTMNYDSKTVFCGDVYNGVITLAPGVSTSDQGVFGGILCASGPFISCATCVTSPCTAPVTPGCFPPTSETPGMYGTCGASLLPGENGLYNIIAQLPGNLSTGFIVQTGGPNNNTPMLVVGLTEENRQGYLTIPLESAGKYPNKNPAWNDLGIKVNTNLSYEGTEQSFIGGLVFDTGDADTTIRPFLVNPGPEPIDCVFLNNCTQDYLVDGVIANNVINDAFNWSVVAGDVHSINKVNVSSMAALSHTYMNTGIDIFYTYNIMFDMQNGLLGFMPIQNIDVSIYSGVLNQVLSDINGIPTTLQQNGPNTVTLTSVNSFSGGTILSGGGLSIFSDYNLGALSGGVTFNGGTLNLKGDLISGRNWAVFSNGGILNTNGYTATLSGTLNGTGTLVKQGRGDLIFTSAFNGNAIFAGGVQILKGTVQVDGNIQTGYFSVGKYGVLQGTGVVGSTVSSGTVKPGDSPGLLTVMGNYTQNRSGTLKIELESLVNYGQLAVSANAYLNGTLLPVSYGGYQPHVGDLFTILTADSILGAFSHIDPIWPTLEVVPLYYPDEVQIVLERNYANPQISLNRNQRAYGSMLNRVSDLTELLTYLNGISDPNLLRSAYDTLIPTSYLSEVGTAFYRTTVTLDHIEDRIRMRSVCPCIPSAYLEVRGLYLHKSSGYQIDGGADYLLPGGILLGLYGDYTYLNNRYHSGALFGYGSYLKGCFFADLIAGGIYNGFHNTRHLLFSETARSHNNSGEAGGLLSFGYSLGLPYGWDISPIALLQGVHLFSSTFRESGAGLLNLQGKIGEQNSVQTGLGMRIRRSVIGASLELYGNWRHECVQERYTMKSSYISEGIPFATESSRPETDFGLFGATFNYDLSSDLEASLSYQGLVGREIAQALSLGLQMSF